MSSHNNQQFFNAVGRHFVTLSCVQTLPGDTSKRILLFSGFIVDIRGLWFYVTAGHILRNIQASLDSGGEFSIWRLGDQTAGNEFKDTAIPFDFDIDKWAVIEDESLGLDYAVTPLNEMYCRLLNAGGVVPIGNDAWGDHLMEHDQWVLVGVPSQSVTYDGHNVIVARPAMIPVTAAEMPELAGSKAQNQFYGYLHQDSQSIVEDIDGMSGGPIFAIKWINEKLHYVVIGIQSGWYSQSRVIAACPFSSLGHALEEFVDTVARENPV